MASNTFIPDYYAILEISQSASSSAIKSAYNKLAFDATAKMQLLDEAYELLCDVDKRRKYDKFYESEIHPELTKDPRILELNFKLQELKYDFERLGFSLCSAQNELTRLVAKRDSLREKRERMVEEKATKERLSRQISSFAPDEAAYLALQARELGEDEKLMMNNIQEVHQYQIMLKRMEIQTLKKDMIMITSAEKEIEAEIQRGN